MQVPIIFFFEKFVIADPRFSYSDVLDAVIIITMMMIVDIFLNTVV